MDPSNGNAHNDLPPPPAVIPPDVSPILAKVQPEPTQRKMDRLPMARLGLGSKGQKIPLYTNHFKVNITNIDGHFFHYSVRVPLLTVS